jgi:Trk K+ transport system NAD-binding subunit
MQELSVLIVGVGGLGKCMLSEALERGARVSLIVRDLAKVKDELGSEMLARVSKIIVGDGSQAALLDEAMPRIDVVLSGRGADSLLAGELAAAVKRHGVKKLCWPTDTGWRWMTAPKSAKLCARLLQRMTRWATCSD